MSGGDGPPGRPSPVEEFVDGRGKSWTEAVPDLYHVRTAGGSGGPEGAQRA